MLPLKDVANSEMDLKGMRQNMHAWEVQDFYRQNVAVPFPPTKVFNFHWCLIQNNGAYQKVIKDLFTVVMLMILIIMNSLTASKDFQLLL